MLELAMSPRVIVCGVVHSGLVAGYLTLQAIARSDSAERSSFLTGFARGLTGAQEPRRGCSGCGVQLHGVWVAVASVLLSLPALLPSAAALDAGNWWAVAWRAGASGAAGALAYAVVIAWLTGDVLVGYVAATLLSAFAGSAGQYANLAGLANPVQVDWFALAIALAASLVTQFAFFFLKFSVRFVMHRANGRRGELPDPQGSTLDLFSSTVETLGAVYVPFLWYVAYVQG